jgi:ATP-binding cassette subfamily F protein 3
MITAENLTVHFGARPVLRDVSFTLGPGERVAIVGPNGAGKTTLLRCCAGQITPEGGRVALPNRCRLGYLSQDSGEPKDRGLLDEIMTVFAEAESAMGEMRELEHRMAEIVDHECDEFHKIAERYDFLQQEIIRLDAFGAEAKAGRVLHGLGFTDRDFGRSMTEFSGGWRMRAELAKILLSEPDVLLLDEPTNYLDIETMLWLERYILGMAASMLFVSHEWAFMDRLATRVFEVVNGQFAVYRGNYSKYLEQREERRTVQQQAFDNQQTKIKQIGDYAAKFRVTARRAGQVQSRLKALDRMEMVEPPPPDPRRMRFKFPPAPRSNKIMVKMENATKAYGAHRVLDRFDFGIERGDKVALVGLNGAGKSTLIKLLAGLEGPTSGAVSIGEMTQLAYFAQYSADELTPTNTVLDELSARFDAGSGNSARDLAGSFLFSGEDAEKQVSVLSGGEKTRLRIAKMLVGTANLLLLDEPTNHLDIGARATLEQALQQYQGAFVLVSHDRHFVDQVANKIYEIADGRVRQFSGKYADYVRKLEATGLGDENRDLSLVGATAATAAPGREADSVLKALAIVAEPTGKSLRRTAQKRKQRDGEPGGAAGGRGGVSVGASASSHGNGKGGMAVGGSVDEDNDPLGGLHPKEARKKLRKLEVEAGEWEIKVAELEETMQRIDAELADPAIHRDGAKMTKLAARRDKASAGLEVALDRWTHLGEQVERLREALGLS